MWGKFPFFAKFLGDGILFLWDTRGLGQASMGNIIINLYRVCRAYHDQFLPDIQKEFAMAPGKLRCGIARGQVRDVAGVAAEEIQNLLTHIEHDAVNVEAAESIATAAGRRIEMTRKQMLTMLASIVSDFTEPLALIRTSLDMVNSKTFGGISEAQESVIDLALQNTDTIKILIDDLKQISAESTHETPR